MNNGAASRLCMIGIIVFLAMQYLLTGSAHASATITLNRPIIENDLVTITGHTSAGAKKQMTAMIIRPSNSVEDAIESFSDVVNFVGQVQSESDSEGNFEIVCQMGEEDLSGVYQARVGGEEVDTPQISNFCFFNLNDTSAIPSMPVQFKKDQNVIDHIETGQISAEIYAKNNSTTDTSATFVLGLYSEGKLINIRTQTLPMAANQTQYFYNEMMVTGDIQTYEMKAFLWNSLSGMRPLAKHYSLVIDTHIPENIPVLLRATDAVAPGSLFSINGEGLSPEGIEIAIKLTNGNAVSIPPGDATRLPTVQVDAKGNFVVARLPGSMTSGIYDVWVKNNFGWSKPIQINKARPLYLSEYEVFEGLEIKLIGRNFDAKEYGSTVTTTQIRLNDDNGHIYPTTINELNPYAATFTVNGVPQGTYQVEIKSQSNDIWRRLTNGQTLSVVSAGTDPLGLGVAWVNTFNWNNIFNVTSYGAIADDGKDDTTAIKNTIKAAQTAGGGIVYFPAGTYDCSRIEMPAYIVLQGENKVTTKLRYNGNGGSAFITAKTGDGDTVGKKGLSRLTLILTDDRCPGSFISFGDGGADIYARTSVQLFVSEVDVFSPVDHRPSDSAKGFVVGAKERVLVKDCHFTGWETTVYGTVVSYETIINNTFEYVYGPTLMNANYITVENNHLIGHPEHKQIQHGLSIRSNSYIYNNVVEGMGTLDHINNDGEPIMSEGPSSYFNFGTINNVEGQNLHVAPITDLTMPSIKWNALYVVIVDGKGLGQWREVKELDSQSNTITIKKPWSIMPDATSKWTLVIPNDNVTFYKNTVRNCGGAMMFYSNNLDGVAVENSLDMTRGLYVCASNVASDFRLCPSYFNRIQGNLIKNPTINTFPSAGVAMTSNNTGFAVLSFGNEIRGNYIIDSPIKPGIQISTTSGSALTYRNITNTIIENNVFDNIGMAIALMKGMYGQVLSGNSYNNVNTHVSDTGSVNSIEQ